MPVVNDVIKSKTSKVLNWGGKAITLTLETAKFIKSRTNNGFIRGGRLATLTSGYAPMSQGWFEWLGHGAVKNWKWLWGTTTWMAKFGYFGTQAADMALMGTKFGIGETGLNQLLEMICNIIWTVHTTPEDKRLRQIADVYSDTERSPSGTRICKRLETQ